MPSQAAAGCSCGGPALPPAKRVALWGWLYYEHRQLGFLSGVLGRASVTLTPGDGLAETLVRVWERCWAPPEARLGDTCSTQMPTPRVLLVQETRGRREEVREGGHLHLVLESLGTWDAALASFLISRFSLHRCLYSWGGVP